MSVLTGSDGVLIGPLTTTWSAPSRCSLNLICSGCTQFYRIGASCSEEGQYRDDTSCWPPAATGVQIASPEHPFEGWGYYSPGISCPAGYSAACTAVHGQRPQWSNQFTLVEGETAVGCCPEGYACTNRNGNTCVRIISGTEEMSMGTCDGTMTTNVRLATIAPFPITEDDDDVVTRVPTLFAPMFQLNYQSSDMIPTETSTSTSTSTTAESSSETSSHPSPTDGADENEQSSDGGLSTGAQAGIGVGVGLAALLLLGVAFWFFRRRRKQQAQAPAELFSSNQPPIPPQEKPPAVFTPHRSEAYSTPSELMSTPRAEMPG